MKITENNRINMNIYISYGTILEEPVSSLTQGCGGYGFEGSHARAYGCC